MNLIRLARHFITNKFTLRRMFPSSSMKAIEQAIADSETRHKGEICFAVECSLDFVLLVKNVSARQRAVQVFSQTGTWDTEHNNGVLIYLLIADKEFEIVADRGITSKVPNDTWEIICKEMENSFRKKEFENGVIKGINSISSYLEKLYPNDGNDVNELPNKPIIL